MTNTQQQTILGQQVTESEQPPQEDPIQLTELLPVEQSRIKRNADGKDTSATDALKALRSFSRIGTSEFEARAFDFCASKLDRSGETDDRYEIRSANTRRKRKLEDRKNCSESCGLGEKGEDRRGEVRMIDNETQTEGSPRDDDDTMGNGSAQVREGSETGEDVHESEGNARMDESKEKEEEEDPGADVRKTRDECFSGPMYALRQNENLLAATENGSGKSCSSHEGRDSSNASNVYVDMTNGFAASPFVGQFVCFQSNVVLASEPVISETVPEEKGPPRAPRAVEFEVENESFYQTGDKDLSEESLRCRIDAIIQANYLLEQENNNVMQRNHNKHEEEDDEEAVDEDDEDGDEEERQREQVRVSNDRGNESTRNLGSTDYLLKKYCCVICSARFKSSGGLRNHYKVVHAVGPIYTCNECGKEFPLKERLKLHVRTHTGFRPYKCSECDKSFARGGQLVQHQRTHSQIKPYRCLLCSGTFTCAANLAVHVKRHNGQKDHKCEICGRGFVRRDALKKHLECLHRDVKSFLCVICNKTFKGHLTQHMRTHAQDRPHGCATCGQRFAQKSQLTVHQRTHSGQRPFRCLVCWQAFAHSTALKLHTRRHTGERPFKCSECNAGFTQLPHWKKHMKCIHGRSEPYCCKNCNSFFRIKNDLESHEKACRSLIIETTAENLGRTVLPKYRVMTVEKMRLLLAVLLKRISKPERLDELGFGKRLIDEVLEDSLVSAGKDPAKAEGLSEFEVLQRNLATFLEWTVPKEHWENFQRMNKTPEEILETLTAI